MLVRELVLNRWESCMLWVAPKHCVVTIAVVVGRHKRLLLLMLVVVLVSENVLRLMTTVVKVV